MSSIEVDSDYQTGNSINTSNLLKQKRKIEKNQKNSQLNKIYSQNST
jgi:hypothetical protein